MRGGVGVAVILARANEGCVAMEELAPEAIGFAAGFGAARHVPVGRHGRIVGTFADRGVEIAVADVEDFKTRIC
jgi:hypothetical protein